MIWKISTRCERSSYWGRSSGNWHRWTIITYVLCFIASVCLLSVTISKIDNFLSLDNLRRDRDFLFIHTRFWITINTIVISKKQTYVWQCCVVGPREPVWLCWFETHKLWSTTFRSHSEYIIWHASLCCSSLQRVSYISVTEYMFIFIWSLLYFRLALVQYHLLQPPLRMSSQLRTLIATPCVRNAT